MKNLKIFGIIIVLLVLSACGGGGEGDDTTPPTVLSTSPLGGATDVDVGTSITATFSEAMDGSTITGSTFTLSSTSPVSGTVTYDSGTNTATLTPSAALGYMTTYTATITTGATDLAGNSISSNYTWSFTTMSAVSLPETGQTTCYDASGNSIDCATQGQTQDGAVLGGVSWPSPRFTDNGDGTVTDNLTGLMWTGDANAPGPVGCTTGATMVWQEALDYVDCLNTNSYLGYNNWRLPNRKELHSLTDFSQSNPALPSDYSTYFSNVQSFYWTSSTYANGTGNAWRIHMFTGIVYPDPKTNHYYVWPVRAGK